MLRSFTLSRTLRSPRSRSLEGGSRSDRRQPGEGLERAPGVRWRTLSSLPLLSDAEFKRLYAAHNLAQIARMLQAGSEQSRKELLILMPQIVGGYDAEIIEV